MIARLVHAAVLVLACVTITPEQEASRQDLVLIHVSVSGNESGSPLTADAFEILVDGKPVPLVDLKPPPTPLNIVLLLDKSASMEVYGDIDEEIGKSFAAALKTGDRARVGGLANRLVLAPAFSTNPKEVVSAGRTAVSFRKEDKFGATPIWDAIDQTVAQLESQDGLRAIILVTDGKATGNTKGILTVADRAVLAGVVVDVLSESRPMIIRQSETMAARIRPSLPLELIARVTGGTIVPENPDPYMQLPEPGPIITKFVDELHEMYTLGIAPTGPSGSSHRLEVRVKREGLTARARSAYRTR
jgi:hypothetical protein